MSYKTILVHVDHSKHAAERIRIATKLALTENAHLIGTAMTGISRFMYQSALPDYPDPLLVINLDFLRERANKALDDFEILVKEMGLSSYEKRLVDDEAGGGISVQARYCDLVVIGQTDLDQPSPSVTADFPEYVLLNCGRPVLIIPFAGHFERIAERPLIAWNASRESTRAVTNAIPFLKRAKKVDVAVFNADAEGDLHGTEPGTDIALYLARHDITVEVQHSKSDSPVGEAILSKAADLGSDLIVMGGYGHSRFREILLSGATRTVRASMTVPVLMSH